MWSASSWCVSICRGCKALALMVHPSQWKLLLYHFFVWIVILPVCLLIDMWLVPLRRCGCTPISAQRIAFSCSVVIVVIVTIGWVTTTTTTTTLSELLAFPDSIKFEITLSGSLFYSLLNFIKILAILLLCFGSLVLNCLALVVFALKFILYFPNLMCALLFAAIVVLVIFKS